MSGTTLTRYAANGTLDPAFGVSGRLTSPINMVGGVAVQADGNVVVAGSFNSNFAVMRYLGTPALGTRLYVQQDANFNVTAITDALGQVVERYVYEPHGSFTVLNADWTVDGDSASDFAWRYLHQGGFWDEHSALYHFRNRDYSPSLGRWVQMDPIGYADG